MSTRKRRRWFKWALLAVIGLGLFSLAVAWLSFQHIPDWYTPAEIPPEHVQAVRDDFTTVQNDLGGKLSERMAARSDAPFDCKISQAQINAWLTAREDIWPLSRDWFPPFVHDPFISIDEQGIRIAARCRYGSLQTVLSARIVLTADERQARFHVAEICGGSLPIPQAWLKGQLSALENRRSAVLPSEFRSQGRAPQRLDDIFKEIALSNECVWWEPKWHYRVIGLKYEPQAVTITIRPQPQRGSQR